MSNCDTCRSLLKTQKHANKDENSDLRRLVNEAHPPRASDIEELLSLQKTQSKPFDEEFEAKQVESISETLKSNVRPFGPRVVKGEGKRAATSLPQSPRSLAQNDTNVFIKAMSDAGLKPVIVYHNLSPAELYEKAITHEKGSHVTSSGALATLSGANTGRSPKDKRLVKEESTQDDVWWADGSNASPNFEMDERTFLLNRERAVDYLNMQDRLYVFDGFAGWDPESRLKIRVVTARPYHALFMHNMLVRPTEWELASFGKPDFTIYNAGAFPANRRTSFMTSGTSIDISLGHKEMVILGAQYAGEMKKGVFTLMNYWLPKNNILSLHSACNVGKEDDVTLFFGLSGTGKTTLSSDPQREIIGDDEHGWSDNGVFNIEGGCYAKAIGLNKETEPDIFDAVRFGTILENVVFDEETRAVDFNSSSITENTRACYPMQSMPRSRIPCMTANHPRNIILLSCDVYGVLPPVSKLSHHQALYYFISGYTSSVVADQNGVYQPHANFSACFGGAFLVWHPAKYAKLLYEKIRTHNTIVWMVNTGWTGGSYGTGERIQLRHTRAIIDAIHSGQICDIMFHTVPIFNLSVPIKVPHVPDSILQPQETWVDKEAYMIEAQHLAAEFVQNFQKYANGGGYMSVEEADLVVNSGPDRTQL